METERLRSFVALAFVDGHACSNNFEFLSCDDYAARGTCDGRCGSVIQQC